MKHKGTVELETDRLTLRKFKLEDASQMYDNWASDERVSRYLSLDHQLPGRSHWKYICYEY